MRPPRDGLATSAANMGQPGRTGPVTQPPADLPSCPLALQLLLTDRASSRQEVRMKNKVCGAMVVLVCGVAMVGAAQNTSSSASQTNSSSSTDKITVTGCVQRADQTATGTSGTV